MNKHNSSDVDDFIFVPPKTVEEKRQKKQGREREPIPYEPEEEEEEEWVSHEFRQQIRSTISSIQGKELKDVEHVYIVLGLLKRVIDPDVTAVLKTLSADVLAYLNETRTKLLISCPLRRLVALLVKDKYASKYFQQVKRIGPLFFEEQVSKRLREDATWSSITKPLLIHLVPNISDEIRQKQLADVLEYLRKLEANLLDYDEAGFLLADLKEQSIRELLQASNFVFRVDGIPQGLVERMRHSVAKKKTYNKKIKSVASSVDSRATATNNLPTICLMDSGISDVPQLSGLVVSKDGYTGFLDFNDGCSPIGHGTPIACLAIYGEEFSEPEAKVISYKLYADNRRSVVFQGLRRAISKYFPETRIFLSSINFDGDYPEAIAFLDRLIQEKNICVVFSAGNIEKQTVLNCIANGPPYPSYIRNFPIKQPAQAITITAVGAISKKDSHATIAHVNELAPFTTCGTRNPFLYQSPKPEVVQHGGNICRDGSASGVGLESVCKDGTRVQDLAGTSFSAPLFARRLAEIEAKYGHRIRNAETLKAIALAGSNREVRDCIGFGETNHFSNCDRFHALIVSEGTISLPDTSRPDHNLYYKAEIHVRIPKFIEKIEMFVVHSDNYTRVICPSLNTFLKVYAYKTGRETGHVSLDNPEELGKKSHMKVFRWSFERRSMEGDWTFVIRPETTADMLAEHRRQTTIRYGCAILVTAKFSSLVSSLSEEIRHLMAQRPYL